MASQKSMAEHNLRPAGRLARTALLGIVLGMIPFTTIAAAWNQPPECAALAVYLDEIAVGSHRAVVSTDVGRDPDEPPTQDDFRAAAEFLRTYLAELNRLDPPAVAQTFHDLLVQGVEAMASMVDVMAVIGYLGILGKEEEVDDLTARIADEALALEQQCALAIYDHDGDGVEEVGIGAASIVVSPAATGRRDAPFPIGSTVVYDGIWSVTVIEVTPDGDEDILAHHELNDPPPDGEHYVLVRMEVTNDGAEGVSFPVGRLRAVGPSTVVYGQFDDDCGLVPDALTIREISPGETMNGWICWSIRTGDIDGLVMYSSSVAPEDRVYLALTESDAEKSAVLSADR